jgi:hypothetical protein
MRSRELGKVLLGLVTVLLMAAPATAQQVAPPPAHHVVQPGETLWGLAQLYFGDPFLWPEIYRLNTAVIEDPHWIFPGEQLVLVPRDQTAVAVPEPAAPPAEQPPPAVPPAAAPPTAQPPVVAQPPVELPSAPAAPPPPPMQMSPTVFANAPRSGGPGEVANAADTFRAVRVGEFYAAGFLTENEKLPWAEVLGNADIAAPRGVQGTSALVYQTVRIRAPRGADYQVGDSLLTTYLARGVPGYGDIVHPTGIVRVTTVDGRDVQADVVLQFSRVGTGQVALPLEPFKDPGSARPVPVADGVQGSILALRDIRQVPSEFDVVFIDLGRNAGIVPGDVFEILPRAGTAPQGEAPQPLGDLRIVHVGERSATGLVSAIYTLGIRNAGENGVGMPVRLIRKMPS